VEEEEEEIESLWRRGDSKVLEAGRDLLVRWFVEK